MQNRNEKIENARHGFGSIFVVAMNAPQTREKYISRLNRFFNFIELSGSAIEERCSNFAREGKGQPKWALNNIMRFLHAQKERVEHKEITGATLRNCIFEGVRI